MSDAIGICAFVLAFGAVTLAISFWLHRGCEGGSDSTPGFDEHPAFYIWVASVVIVTFAVCMVQLNDAKNEDRPTGCSVTVPYGQRTTIDCRGGES